MGLRIVCRRSRGMPEAIQQSRKRTRMSGRENRRVLWPGNSSTRQTEDSGAASMVRDRRSRRSRSGSPRQGAPGSTFLRRRRGSVKERTRKKAAEIRGRPAQAQAAERRPRVCEPCHGFSMSRAARLRRRRCRATPNARPRAALRLRVPPPRTRCPTKGAGGRRAAARKAAARARRTEKGN